MAEETLPIFTANDFPNEIIEKFAPDNRPRTISNLRLVNTRFRDVFSADRFYRSYLWYSYTPERYREDLEEIGDKPDRWKLCLEAEKKRLENWRNGRPTRVDSVKITSYLGRFGVRWHGKTGENGDLWLLAECIHPERRILLLNVTKSPPILTEVDMRSYTHNLKDFATLLPYRVVDADNQGSNHVFDIRNNGSKLHLEYKFNIQTSGDSVVFVSGKTTKTRALRSLCVIYTRIWQVNPNPDTVLRVWDVKTGVELESIDLWQLLSPRCARDFRDTIRTLWITASEFPCVVVEIWYGCLCKILAVLNVEEGQLVFCFEREENVDHYNCEVKMSGNTACVSYITLNKNECWLRVYDLGVQPNFKDKTGLLYECSSSGTSPVHYEFPMFLIKTDKMLKLVAIDRLEYFQRLVVGI